MHPNPAFRRTRHEQNIAFARDRAFGTLALNGPDAPLLSHVPFSVSGDGQRAELHLVRSNPIVRACTAPQPAVIAVQGADGYISPDWYGIDDQVPTWNYVAVHLRGVLHPMPPDRMRPVLDTLSAQFEDRLAPKRPGTSDKMPPDLLDRMMRSILPFELHITQVDGTWKLSQNKSDAARLSAAEGLPASEIGSQTGTLAALMRTPPDPED